MADSRSPDRGPGLSPPHEPADPPPPVRRGGQPSSPLEGPLPLRDAGPLRVLAPLHDYQPGAHPILSDDPAAHPTSRFRSSRHSTAGHTGILATAVGLLVLVASVVGVNPAHPGYSGGTGNVNGDPLGLSSAPRLAIGGGVLGEGPAFAAPDGASSVNGTAADGPAAGDLTAADLAAQVDAFSTAAPAQLDSRPATENDPAAAAVPDGPFLADGTLLKPVAVDTSNPDARGILINYRVKKGDSLSSIAEHYRITLSSLWWANHLATGLTGSTDLKIGQRLVVPPVSGVLHVVTDHETLADIAKRTRVSSASIVATNKLGDPTLHVGQWILIPGAKNKPVPLPKPAPPPPPPAPPTSTASSPSAGSAGSHAVVRAPSNYSGGRFNWPVPGGFISQYFHAGHLAIDIAGTFGEPVEAAAAGVVVFSGWKNNGGGYQVWLSHGSGLYTAYYHMSAVIVGIGQSVGRGQQVGRLGMTGWATGPHCHFEVWIGPVDEGYRVNPLSYF